MFRKAKQFVQNHWKKMVIGGVVVQVASYGLRYATDRFIAYQDDQARQYWKVLQKQQVFDVLDKNIVTTYIRLVEEMKKTIHTTLHTDLLLEKLKNNEVEHKLEAWEELKIVAFARILSTIYGTSLLYVLVRIQLSMIGGYMSKAKNNDPTDAETQARGEHLDEHFMDQCSALPDTIVVAGCKKMCEYILAKARHVVSELPLKQVLTASDIEELFWAIIRKEVTPEEIGLENAPLGNPCKYPWNYILPKTLLEDPAFFHNAQLSTSGSPDAYKKFVCDTYDLLESDDVKGVLRFFESHGVSHYIDRISESFAQPPADDQSVFVEPTVVVAKLIPVMNSLPFIDVLDDPWIHLLTNSESVRALSANIFESFSCE